MIENQTLDAISLEKYDHNGNCVKQYIYFGNKLLAEYQPQTNKYYYYMTDQINSTRIVTDDNGDVVYSEAYGPFGDVQKTWTNTYDPKLKFSGKERETYSDLDYFGARYYDHNSYRFISVDPIINKDEALSNPQLWNLYSYCRNNPLTYFDPDGRYEVDGYADSMAMHFAEKNGADITDIIQLENKLKGIGAAIGFAAFLAPEIIAATGPFVSKTGEKIIPLLRYKRLFDSLSKNSIKHISKHLDDFRVFNPKMTLRNIVDLGHKIINNSKNLISRPGGRGVYQSIEKIGGVKLPIRAVTDTAGKLKSVHIRWDQIK